MLDRLERAYRGLATGFCFVVFGVGELLGIVPMVVVFGLFVRDPVRRQRWGKLVLQKSFRAFVELMRMTGALSYEMKNLERLDRPGLLLVANHPTLIDIVFLISFLPRADCIVKASLTQNPFTRFAIGAAALIPNSLSGLELVRRCSQSLEEGNTLVIFPEGSRSEPDALLPFQRGPSHIAVRAQRDVTPVVIRVSEHNLGRKSHWWAAPPSRMHFEFDVRPDVSIRPFLDRQPELPAAARELTAFLTNYFREQLETPWKTPGNTDALESELKQLIVGTLKLEGVNPGDIVSTEPLFKEGLGLDSIDALELGAAVQKKYGMRFSSDPQEARKHFASVRALANFLQMAQPARAGDGNVQ